MDEISEAVDTIAAMMEGRRTVAITGAGISTGAGLPDYRGTGSAGTPTVDIEQFLSDPMWQRWVWQRNQETWRAVAALEPTPGHIALAQLEKAGLVNGVATQNVDDLHTKAGSRNVYELHGNFSTVQCLGCGQVTSREALDARLRVENPAVVDDPDPAHAAILAAADRQAAARSTFVTVPCEQCGGVLKPAVVFFGENLPGDALEGSFAVAKQADVALVVGTSLAVLTGLWVVREAWGTGSQLVVINRGPTAVDDYADVRVEGDASEVLSAVARRLLG